MKVSTRTCSAYINKSRCAVFSEQTRSQYPFEWFITTISLSYISHLVECSRDEPEAVNASIIVIGTARTPFALSSRHVKTTRRWSLKLANIKKDIVNLCEAKVDNLANWTPAGNKFVCLVFNGTSTQEGQCVLTVGGWNRLDRAVKDGQRDTMHMS